MQQKVALPGVFQLFGSSFRFALKYWKELLFITGVPLGIIALFQIFFEYIQTFDGNVPLQLLLLGLGFMGILLSYIFYFYSIVASYKFVLNAFDGVAPGLGKAYSSALRPFFPALWVAILTLLCTFGSALLLIIPGIAVYFFLPYALPLAIDGKNHGISALSESFQLVRGNWWRVFGRLSAMFLGTWILIFIIAVIILIISYSSAHATGSLWTYATVTNTYIFSLVSSVAGWIISIVTIPYYMYLYRANLNAKKAMVAEKEIIGTKNFFVGLSIWGVVSVILYFCFILVLISFVGFASMRNQSQQDQDQQGSQPTGYGNDNGSYSPASYGSYGDVSNPDTTQGQ